MEPQQRICGSTLSFWLVEIVVTLWIGSLVGLETCGQECQISRVKKEYLRFYVVFHVLAHWQAALLIHHLDPLNASVSNACTKLGSLGRFSRRSCTCGSCHRCRAQTYDPFFLPHFLHHFLHPDHLLLLINLRRLNFKLLGCFIDLSRVATSTFLTATSSLASSIMPVGHPSSSHVASAPSLSKSCYPHPSDFSHCFHLCSAGLDLVFVSPTSVLVRISVEGTYTIAITCYNDKLFIICKVINL